MRQTATVAPPYVPFPQHLPREAAIAGIAEGQHGVITLAQLRGLGLSSSAVRKRAADGRLHRLYRGVFSVRSRRLDPRRRWMAAVLAYGSRALLAHRTGAAHLGILPGARARIDISVPRG